MAMVPSGGGEDDFSDSSAAPPELGSWSVGGPNHPTFCFFKGAADGLSGGLMGSVFGFGNSNALECFHSVNFRFLSFSLFLLPGGGDGAPSGLSIVGLLLGFSV